jgi:hypothetical protein
MKEKKAAVVEWKVPTVPDKKALTKRMTPLLEQSHGYAIKSEDHFLASWALVQRHDEAIKKIEELFDPFISGLYKLHRMAIAMRDEFLKPVQESKNRLLGQRKVFRAEQEAIKREQDAKAARLLQQQQQKELERQAKSAERKGDTEVAEVLREQKAAVPLPFMNTAPAVPKQEGSVIKKRWVFEIIDPSQVEREYCSPDSKLIRPVVENLGPACKIGGLRIWEEEKEHSRSVPA